MSGNNIKGSAYYSTLTDAEAFELCHADVREALRSCVFSWSAAWALNYQRKRGSKATVDRLRKADANTIRSKPWKGNHGETINSPIISLRMKPLYEAQL